MESGSFEEKDSRAELSTATPTPGTQAEGSHLHTKRGLTKPNPAGTLVLDQPPEP